MRRARWCRCGGEAEPPFVHVTASHASRVVLLHRAVGVPLATASPKHLADWHAGDRRVVGGDVRLGPKALDLGQILAISFCLGVSHSGRPYTNSRPIRESSRRIREDLRRIRGSSRTAFARIREDSRRIREDSRTVSRGFATDSRRIPSVTRVHESDSRKFAAGSRRFPVVNSRREVVGSLLCMCDCNEAAEGHQRRFGVWVWLCVACLFVWHATKW